MRPKLWVALGMAGLAFGLVACGGSTSGPRACCGPPDTVTTPVTDDTVPPADGDWIEELPDDTEADIVTDNDYDGPIDVVEDDTDFDGIPDSEDIDVYEDSDNDGIANDEDISLDDPIVENHENSMDATNVWTDADSGW